MFSNLRLCKIFLCRQHTAKFVNLETAEKVSLKTRSSNILYILYFYIIKTRRWVIYVVCYTSDYKVFFSHSASYIDVISSLKNSLTNCQ